MRERMHSYRAGVWAAGVGGLIGLAWGLVLTVPSLETLFVGPDVVHIEGTSGSAFATVLFVAAHVVLLGAFFGVPALLLSNALSRRSRAKL